MKKPILNFTPALMAAHSFAQNTTYFSSPTGTVSNLNGYLRKVTLILISVFSVVGAFAQNYNTNYGTQTNSSTNGTYNSLFGYISGHALASGGNYNSALGYSSLYTNTTGSYNNAFGYNSLYLNVTGNDNNAFGSAALYNNTGSYNNAFGYQALFTNTSGGSNTAMGYMALNNNVTGSNNTAIGFSANVSTGSLTNATAIGNGATATASNSIQLGNGSVTKVYAGTGSAATLITGGLQVTGGAGANMVLTSDASGLATWKLPVVGLWTSSTPNIYFNTGTVGIGTATPNTSYKLDVNGIVNATGFYLNGAAFGSQWTTSGANIYNNTGTVGIGTTTPNAVYKLDVNGAINASSILINGSPFAGGGSQWATSGANIYYSTTGNVGIGTSIPDAKLAVLGQVHANEVKIDLLVPGPDYVFEKEYKLASLEEVKNYIDQNKHLPEVPSAKEMEKNGVHLGEMNMLLLKKIEELTLHMIEQEKRIKQLENGIK